MRNGVFSVDEFRIYSKLLNWRSKGDYSDLFDFMKEDVQPMMEPVKNFIDKIKDMINLD